MTLSTEYFKGSNNSVYPKLSAGESISLGRLRDSVYYLIRAGYNYSTVIDLVDSSVMEGCKEVYGNQTEAAEAIGLNRGTFRKKLEASCKVWSSYKNRPRKS